MAHAASEPSMRACIDACSRCQAECLGRFSQHCLNVGGAHTEPAHARLMLSCASVCRAAIEVMLTGASIHKAVCHCCAEVCEACAQSCEAVGDMQACVDACRRCAESCRRQAA